MCAGIHLPGLTSPRGSSSSQEPPEAQPPHLAQVQGWLSLDLQGLTPKNRASHRGCCEGIPSAVGLGRCRERGELCYSLTEQARAVIKISFFRIKYLSANTISGCEKPGLCQHGGLEVSPAGTGVCPSR